MALNILCTILIIVPLLRARRHIIKALGQHHGQLYTSIAAIIIESALPNAVFSLLWVILYAKQNTAENLFITVLIQIQVCITRLFLAPS
jgi:ABC-type microcin C transport system permease subunit YejB